MLGGNVEDSLHLSFSRILCINDFFENFIQFFMNLSNFLLIFYLFEAFESELVHY